MIAYLAGFVAVALIPNLAWVPLLLMALLVVRHFTTIQLVLMKFVVAVVVATLWGQWQLSHRLPIIPKPVDLVIEGEVVSLVKRDVTRQRAVLALTDIISDQQEPFVTQLRRVQLSLYRSDQTLQAGDQIRATVRLFPPQSYQNPNAYDRQRADLINGIDAVGYIRGSFERLEHHYNLAYFRSELAAYLDNHFPTPEVSGTLKALLLGDKQSLSFDLKQVAAQTGTSHLMVVSGLHLAVIAGAVFLVIGRLLYGLSYIRLYSGKGQRALAAFLVLAICGGYLLLSGAGLPVQRAYLMLSVFMLVSIILVPLTLWQRWKIALVVVVTLSPLSVLQPGLWLSFLAVALIIWAAQSSRNRSKLWLVLRVQSVIFIGMLLLNIVLFQRFSLVMPFINLLAIPLVSLFLVLLPLLLAVHWLGLQTPVVWLIEHAVQGYWQMLIWVSEHINLQIHLALPPVWAVVVALISTLCVLLPLPRLLRFYAAIGFLPLFTLTTAQPQAGEFRMTLFDVGQGLAALVQTAKGALLYDTGPGFSGGTALFNTAVSPYLMAQGVNKLDAVVVSHSDNDHAGGVDALVNDFSVEHWILGEPLNNSALQRQNLVSVQSCMNAKGMQMLQMSQTLGIKVDFFRWRDAQTDNDRSCVLLLSHEMGCSVLFTGDLSQTAEPYLVDWLAGREVDVLVVGHHGSRSSTSELLLEQIKPRIALISRGRYNRYGHPTAEVMARLKQHHIKIYDTALTGAAFVDSSRHCQVAAYNDQRFGYWHQ